ncbi:MAG: transaldolase family protein [Christensenellales bacterium]
MRKSYFHRVHEYTQTRFWINNPTTKEAHVSIAHGAINCTTNPTYAGKMLRHPDMRETALEWVREALSQTGDESKAAAIVQRKAIKNLLDIWLAVFKAAPGKEGFVSLQVDPFKEEDPKNIIDEALETMSLGPNILAKIPVTEAGLEAIDFLVRKNVPTIATEIMSISQVTAACETYRKASRESGHEPAYFVTNIAGIFDDCLKMQNAAGEISIDPDILFQAGTALGKKQYRLMKERGYPGIMLGGGARGLHHFTEFVGGRAHITINWKGCADELVEKDGAVISRMDNPTPEYVIDALMKAPDFAMAYIDGAIEAKAFADFAPVELFRSQFLSGWQVLLEEIKAVKEGK